MSLAGTKTEQNLKDAFAGESQANRRYLFFAQKADVEGFNDVAAVFRSTAEGETGHAHGHLRHGLLPESEFTCLRVEFFLGAWSLFVSSALFSAFLATFFAVFLGARLFIGFTHKALLIEFEEKLCKQGMGFWQIDKTLVQESIIDLFCGAIDQKGQSLQYIIIFSSLDTAREIPVR